MIGNAHFPPFPRRQVIQVGIFLAAVWVLCAAIGWLREPESFYRAYLLAWLFWLGVSLGSMAMVMLHHLMGGHWGYMIRRLGEHAAMTMPLLIVLFVPILIGMHSLYPWDRADELAHDPILRHEEPYLNGPFFICRAALYGVVALTWAWYLRSASLRHDKTGDPRTALLMHNVSAGGMVVYFALMSFASVDWIMSREPHWFSTVFGFVIIAGQAISGLCVLIVIFTLMSDTPPFRDRARPEYLNDLGNLLLTLVILWAYLSFAQLLVIWMGNKQDEIPWYVHRLTNGWLWLGVALVVLHFFVPFIILLMRDLKRKAPLMLTLCACLLVLRLVDLFWQVEASGAQPYIRLRDVWSWMDVAFPIGMGALWLTVFLWLSIDHPLMPAGEVAAIGAAPVGET
ncbi:MAG TPA: hypothetical protein VL992_00320 [Tepidisphaeraceae bacterium]|nr:hypothetical protein [Tepidisphaeraceae bacterium]